MALRIALSVGLSLLLSGIATAWPRHGMAPADVTRNISEFGSCDGAGVAAFNAWALTWQAANPGGLIQLNINSGTVCVFDGPDFPARGVKRLRVMGYGATFTGAFALGGNGICHKGIADSGGCSARIATVAAGASTVTLLNSALISRFTVGGWVLVGGFNIQSVSTPAGYPPNLHYFEYRQIAAISSPTVTFTAPLANTYKSTWPLYNSGNIFEADAGGPATIYALDTWDSDLEYRGLTFDTMGQVQAIARSVQFIDVNASGVACPFPTQNYSWTVTTSTLLCSGLEVDKLVTNATFHGGTVQSVSFQSSSVDTTTFNNATINTFVDGSPKRLLMNNTTMTSLSPGANSYGRSDEIICTNCVISSSIADGGYIEKGPTESGVNIDYSMSGGIIAVPNGFGSVRWAVPGTNLFWSGFKSSETSFRVVDVTQDADNTYIHTTLAGGFPPVPLTAGKLYIQVHPAPKFTCNPCTGNADAVDLAQPGAQGQPLWSYSKRTYTQATLTSSAAAIRLWGTITSFDVNVTVAYAGATTPLTFFGTSPFNNQPILLASDYSQTTYGPDFNLRAAGNRVITSAGVAGAQTGDSGLAFPQTSPANPWWMETIAPAISADVSASGTFSVTIEAITDQGVVNP